MITVILYVLLNIYLNNFASQVNSFMCTMWGCRNVFSSLISVIKLSMAAPECFTLDLSTHFTATTDLAPTFNDIYIF